jgi:hypothetical protein
VIAASALKIPIVIKLDNLLVLYVVQDQLIQLTEHLANVLVNTEHGSLQIINASVKVAIKSPILLNQLRPPLHL